MLQNTGCIQASDKRAVCEPDRIVNYYNVRFFKKYIIMLNLNVLS
jgi:hypothetical protein